MSVSEMGVLDNVHVADAKAVDEPVAATNCAADADSGTLTVVAVVVGTATDTHTDVDAGSDADGETDKDVDADGVAHADADPERFLNGVVDAIMCGVAYIDSFTIGVGVFETEATLSVSASTSLSSKQSMAATSRSIHDGLEDEDVDEIQTTPLLMKTTVTPTPRLMAGLIDGCDVLEGLGVQEIVADAVNIVVVVESFLAALQTAFIRVA